MLLFLKSLRQSIVLCTSSSCCPARIICTFCHSEHSVSFRLTDENFGKARILVVISVCILHIISTRTALQSYLNIAYERVKKLRRETGKITNVELQSKVRTRLGTWSPFFPISQQRFIIPLKSPILFRPRFCAT